MTTYTQPDENSTTYTESSRSDYVANSAAKFGTAKFSKAKFGKDSDYTFYSKDSKNSSSYTYDAKN